MIVDREIIATRVAKILNTRREWDFGMRFAAP